mgnify:CR=1 FL=1
MTSGGLLCLLVVFSVGCGSIQVMTPVLNEDNADSIADEVTRSYHSTYFAYHTRLGDTKSEPSNMFALEESTTAARGLSKALVARDWSGTRYVVYAKSLGQWNYIVQVSEHKPDGEVIHMLYRVTAYKDAIGGWEYMNLKEIASKDFTITEMGSGVSIPEVNKIIFDEIASARYPGRILEFVGGLSEARTSERHGIIRGGLLVPERNAEVVKAFWKKKQREEREQIAKTQRENEDREPTEDEMSEAIRGTLAGALFGSNITKLGGCRRAAAHDYYCRYRYIGTNWGNFWKENGAWYFKIVRE